MSAGGGLCFLDKLLFVVVGREKEEKEQAKAKAK